MDSNLQSSVTNNALPQSPTNNLDVSAATYLGGSDDDFTNAVDISADGNFVIVGGSLKNTNLGGEDNQLLGGGDGTIVRYDSQTNQVVATTRLPGKVLDLEVSNNGDIAVAYEGGIAVLNADATAVKWNKSLNNVSRIAISDGGKVGVVEDIEGAVDKAYLFDSNGQQLKEWSTNSGSRHFYDIAVTDQEGGMVIATGYDQKSADLQVAFTQAWAYQGDNLWKSYDFTNTEVSAQNLMADTRGTHVAIGRDGQLYASYKVNGGTGSSIFSRDPNDLSQKLTSDRKIETDKYNTPTNIGSVQITWYGRYNLKDGDLIKGQSLLSRIDSSGKGNSITTDSIAATENGTVILAGGAAYRIANRDQQTIEEQAVSEYDGFEGYLAVISPDLTQRLSWTPITASDGAVAAVRGGKTAVVTTTDFKGGQITHNAIQDSAGGKNDGYLLVIGGSDVPPGSMDEGDPDTESEPPTNPGDNPDTESEPPTNPGDNPDTESEPPTNPGDNPDTESEPPTNPGDNPDTENETPVNPGDNPDTENETPVNPGDNPDTENEPPINPGDNPDTENETPVNPGDNPDTENEPPINPGDNPDTENENPVNPGDNPDTENENPVNPGDNPDTENENPDSLFPAGLIDLTEIDLNTDNQVNFSGIESEASYDNSFGYYAIANINGAVKDILTGELINPEEEGYAKAALNQRVENLELRRDTGNSTSELSGGLMLVPFLIANGTVEEWMEENINNESGNDPIAYFSFLGANPDSKQHIRQVGNELQFEDLFNGGDNDFNDFVTKFDLQAAV